MTDGPSLPPEDGGRPQNLGAILRTSRERKGLELDDVAEVTHVRREYLRALEEGRYGDLPEDVYARNFLRLYAQAVGLESGKLLDLFARERSGGRAVRSEAPAPEPRSTPSRPSAPRGDARAPAARPGQPAPSGRAPESRPPRSTPEPFGGASSRAPAAGPPRIRIGSMLGTVVLVGVIVGIALWAFNTRLFNAGRGTPPPTAADGGAIGTPLPEAGVPLDAPQAEGSPEATEQARDVLLSVDSDPPGAEVTVDGFPLPGTTPVRDVPVTGRASRVVRVTLDGYVPFESTYDLSFDRTLSVILEPQPTEPAAGQEDAAPAAEGPPPTVGSGQIALEVTEATWLEVYSGTARGQGSRLVYTTAQPGDRYVFDLPVYVHVGNAAGLHVTVDGQDLGNFGSPGAVVGRAFTR